jgi:calcium-dependent protein kinase
MKIFNSIDTDNDNFITYSEFVTASVNRDLLLSKKKLKSAFRIFDKDESGTIDLKELKTILLNGHVDENTIK